MACAVLLPSARALASDPLSRNPAFERSARAYVVVLRAGADSSAKAAAKAETEVAGTEFIEPATVRALAGRQRLLDGRGHQLTLRSRSRLAVRVQHWFGLTEMFEAREGVQL